MAGKRIRVKFPDGSIDDINEDKLDIAQADFDNKLEVLPDLEVGNKFVEEEGLDTKAGALVRGAYQGFTGKFGEEAAARLSSLWPGNGTYDEEVQKRRDMDAVAEGKNPEFYHGGETAGQIISSILGGSAKTAAGIAGVGELGETNEKDIEASDIIQSLAAAGLTFAGGKLLDKAGNVLASIGSSGLGGKLLKAIGADKVGETLKAASKSIGGPIPLGDNAAELLEDDTETMIRQKSMEEAIERLSRVKK